MVRRFTWIIAKLSPRITLRALLTIVLVTSLLLYPWKTSGPIVFDSSDPRLVFVSPTLGGGAVFDQTDRQVNVLGNLTGAPRLDFVSSESSFVFQTDAKVITQTVSPSSDWNWVSVNTPHPWNAVSFNITIEAGQGTYLDVAVVRLTDAVDKTGIIFQTDFARESGNGWALVNNATFMVSGSPPLPSIHLASTTGGFQSAHTTLPLRIPGSVGRVFVAALVRFEQGAGPFRVAVEWLGANGELLSDAAEWGAWAPYFESPASLIVQIWHPQIQEEARLRFKTQDSFSGQIFLELTSFRSGIVYYNQSIAPYHVGERFHLSAGWERAQSVNFSVSNDSGLTFNWSSIGSSFSPGLKEIVNHSPLAISILPQGAGLTTDVALYSPVYIFPGSGRFADLSANALPFFLALLGLALLVVLWLPEEAGLIQRLSRNARRITNFHVFPSLRRHLPAITFLGLSNVLYFLVALRYGGHPFDNAVFKTWIYGGQLDGLQGVYARSSSVGDSFVRGDNFPWSSLGFGYLPFAAYLMLLFSRLLPSFGSFPTQVALFGSSSLEADVKWLLGLSTLITGFTIYWIVRRRTRSERRALLAMAIFVLNPAIVFDSVVWGETDAILYLAFTLFALFALKRPTLATILFFLALGVKQTGIFLILPMALILFKRGSSASKQAALTGKAAAVFFVGIVPLIAGGVLPSALLKPLVTKLGDIGTSAGGVTPLVSPDTYTVWTTFTPLMGVSGPQTLQFSANIPVLGFLSFSFLGYLSFSLITLTVFFFAQKSARRPGPAFWFCAVAFASIAFTSLITGAASRYYTLAIPGLTSAIALNWKELSTRLRVAAVQVLVSISSVSFWTMSGLFTLIMSREFPDIRGLQPAQNSLMAFVGEFYLKPSIVITGSLSIAIALILSAGLLLKLAGQQSSDLYSDTPPLNH
jgi:hypothetical protein